MNDSIFNYPNSPFEYFLVALFHALNFGSV